MPQPEMKVKIDPPMSQWHQGPLREQCAIATGHQLWHWHPGILAKYYAVDAFAQKPGGRVLNVWVNHDTVDATRIELPVIDGDRAGTRAIHLGPCDATLPTCVQPAIDPDHAVRTLTEAAEANTLPQGVNVDRLVHAWKRAPREGSLDQQMVAVMTDMLRGHVQPFQSLLSSQLLEKPAARSLVSHMLDDAKRCVQHFNEAVAAQPAAGIRPLLVEPHRVELPLWALADRQPRQRVFADLSDRKPILTLESGEPVSIPLAPRALLLTALMRAYFCELFIHGSGGGVYDQIMEQWWNAWTGISLAPMAVVSADVFLPFDGVPLAERKDVDRAIWFAHHLPHNVERFVTSGEADFNLAARKNAILTHMDDDRDRQRRRTAFRELHDINASLAASHPQLMANARSGIDQAMVGLENQRVGQKRDWCFSLYPIDRLDRLRRKIATG
ncbi:MAG: hypothetical protein WD768_22700 [Phycisphaeraceae bacterium]